MGGVTSDGVNLARHQALGGCAALVTCDGSCIGNPGPGGWAAVVLCDDRREEIYGSEGHTTNNRMELRAVIEGLRLLRPGSPATVVTDSKYVKDGVTLWLAGWKRNGWRRPRAAKCEQRVANVELWEELDGLASLRDLRWRWVRGHSGHAENERCHRLALAAARAAAGPWAGRGSGT